MTTGAPAPFVPRGFNLEGAAFYTGQSIDVIKRARARNDIPTYYPNSGGRPAFKREDLDAWMDSWPDARPERRAS